MNGPVAQVVVDCPAEGPFDYLVPAEEAVRVKEGTRVQVRFHHRRMMGVVVGLRSTSAVTKLNRVQAVLDASPALDTHWLRIARRLGRYYGCSLGEAVTLCLPAVLRGCRKMEEVFPEIESSPRESRRLLWMGRSWAQQKSELKEILQEAVSRRQTVLILVPDGHTAVFLAGELGRPGTLILDHTSGVREALRRWVAIRRGEISVVIGTRSAVFAPLPRLGWIVLFDEEHDFYTEEQRPYYDARRLAAWRAEIEGAGLLFLSVAPSAETWATAHREGWRVARSSLDQGVTVKVSVVDMNNYRPGRTSRISAPLKTAVEEALAQGQKVLLFLNRRGFTTLTRCVTCATVLRCPRCEIPLIYFRTRDEMVCRACGFSRPMPEQCPQCKERTLQSIGKGVERLQGDVRRWLPHVNVVCLDREHPAIPDNAEVVLATQGVLRWRYQRAFDVTGILDIDAELSHMDFRCAQKAFSLVCHLTAMTRDRLIVQTHMPDQYVIQSIRKNDVDGFYAAELALRGDLGFPPFQGLATVRFRGKNSETVLTQAQETRRTLLKELMAEEVTVSDVYPASPFKLRDKYRYNILVKGRKGEDMGMLVKEALDGIRRKRGVTIVLEVDR